MSEIMTNVKNGSKKVGDTVVKTAKVFTIVSSIILINTIADKAIDDIVKNIK